VWPDPTTLEKVTDHAREGTAATSENYQVTVHVDQSALANGDGRKTRTVPTAIEGGFRIERDYQDRWFFKRPDGRAIPACGYQAQDVTDDDIWEFSILLNHPSAEGLTEFMPLAK
jgi:hypothetical protein